MDAFTADIQAAHAAQLNFLLEVLEVLPEKESAFGRFTEEQLKETLRGIGVKDVSLQGRDKEDLVIGVIECRDALRKEIERRNKGGEPIPKPHVYFTDKSPRKSRGEATKSKAKAAPGKAKGTRARKAAAPASEEEEESEHYEVEEVVGHNDSDEGRQYLVKFKGYDEPEYVDEEDMAGSKQLVDAYLAGLSKAKPKVARANTMVQTAQAGKAAVKKANKKGSMKRANTMAAAATDGEAFLAVTAPDSKSTRSRPKAQDLGRGKRARSASSAAQEPPAKKARKSAAKEEAAEAAPAPASVKKEKKTPAKKEKTPAKKEKAPSKKATPAKKTPSKKAASPATKKTPEKKATPSRPSRTPKAAITKGKGKK